MTQNSEKEKIVLNDLQLGWIDYSSEHRNKVMAVLDLLSAKEAVDELGIGLIRDGFADILFPGTSTIQTRAKYFFIVPYLLMELEREHFSSPDKLLTELGKKEIDLIEKLKQGGGNGVIGARSGQNLKRKPSNIYWSGLRTFDFFKFESLSLTNYAKAVIAMQKKKRIVTGSGNDEKDDLNAAHAEYVSTFWQCLLPEKNWKEKVSMDLTPEESYFLKEKIHTAVKSKNTLFSFLLSQQPEELEKAEKLESIGEIFSLPSTIEEDYQLAKEFSYFISGANIRYNMILSNRENVLAEKRWENWINSSFVKEKFRSYNYMDVISRLRIGNPRLIKFLKEWQQAVLLHDETVIDHLIVKREIELKTKERAKLNNTNVYAYKEGEWVGNPQLDYRFRIAKTIMNDIFTTLEV